MFLRRLIAYAELMRLHRPIGIFLLLWPTVSGLWIATAGRPSLGLLLIFIAGVVIMRSAGCIINDIADRNFDGFVTRTKDRPLATGSVTLTEAFLLFIGLLVIAFLLVLMLNLKTIILAIVALMLAILYPFCKRFTYLPQLVLGMAWYIGVLMTFTATNHFFIPSDAWLLYLSTIIWTTAYDTMYALADREDDIKIGIKSMAVLMGSLDRPIIAGLQLLTWLCWLMLGVMNDFSTYYFLALIVILSMFGYQQILIYNRKPILCVAAFLHNNWVGAVLFIGIATSI